MKTILSEIKNILDMINSKSDITEDKTNGFVDSNRDYPK